MPFGNPPGPIGASKSLLGIDDGTLVLTNSPIPGSVGLRAKESGAKIAAVSLGDTVAGFARGKTGQRVGSGECFDLADRALRSAGAKSAADFSPVVPNADYQWGASINLEALRPGDIIQFRGYRYDRTIETDTDINSNFQERPHHTAIVNSVGAGGAVTVLEQNAPEGSGVHISQLFFSDSNSVSGGKKTTITVQGQFWFYRPLAR
jgi:hypothetical protein